MAAMGAVDVDPKKMKKFYDAYQYFASLLQNKKFKIDFRLEAGDIFCFNNRRVLHGGLNLIQTLEIDICKDIILKEMK